MTRRKSEQIDVLEALRSLRRRAADDDQLASKILTAAIREIEDLRIKVEDLEAQLADPLRDLLDTPETVEAKVKNAAALAAHLRDLLQDCGDREAFSQRTPRHEVRAQPRNNHR